jgi:hypothetical protein
VPDHGRLLGQLADHVVEVIGDQLHGLVGEDVGVGSRLLDAAWGWSNRAAVNRV